MEDVITPTAEELELLKSLRSTGYDPNANRKFGEPPVPNPLTISVTRVPTASAMAKKRLDTVSAVGQTHYLDGVQHPKVSPMGAAQSDAAQARYENAMKDPNTLKRRQDNLRGVTDTTWLGIIEAVGADNYTRGVVAKAYKYEQFATKYEAQLKTILSAADAMPVTTLDQRIAKSNFVIKQLAALKGKLR